MDQLSESDRERHHMQCMAIHGKHATECNDPAISSIQLHPSSSRQPDFRSQASLQEILPAVHLCMLVSLCVMPVAKHPKGSRPFDSSGPMVVYTPEYHTTAWNSMP